MQASPPHRPSLGGCPLRASVDAVDVVDVIFGALVPALGEITLPSGPDPGPPSSGTAYLTSRTQAGETLHVESRADKTSSCAAQQGPNLMKIVRRQVAH